MDKEPEMKTEAEEKEKKSFPRLFKRKPKPKNPSCEGVPEAWGKRSSCKA